MKSRTLQTLAMAVVMLLAVGVSADESEKPAGSDAAATPDAAAKPADAAGGNPEKDVSAAPAPPADETPRSVIYKPPSPGKPVRTVGGGSRGNSSRVPRVFTLTPEHVGLTISEQPALFWFIDELLESATVEFVLQDQAGIEPLLATTLAMPDHTGIQRIRLADHGVELLPGREYEWSVTLVLDPDKRSKDIVASGWIDRVETSGPLAARLAGADPASTAAFYAEAGLWYDTLAAIDEQIQRNPGDPLPLRQRAELLRQVGLLEVAEAGS